MKFLDKAFNKFVTWFDLEQEETEQQRESRLRFLQGLSPVHKAAPSEASLPRRLKMPEQYWGLGTWETRQDPYATEQMVEVYVPALEEMSQRELADIVVNRVAAAFKDTEPTVDTERVRYAVYRIGAFRSRDGRLGYFRTQDDLMEDLYPVYESCNVLVKFVEQEIENCADPVDDAGLTDFIRAAQYLITMANRTYVSVIAQDSIARPYGSWKLAPSSLPCWPGLANLAGKEAA